MLTQRLAQHGVITDLSQVRPDDVTAMAARAEEAKLQAQYAKVYARGVRSLLKSVVKVANAQASMYKDADKGLRDMDRAKLDGLKAELGHRVHASDMQAKAESAQTLAQAKQASVVELEHARLNGRLVQLGITHRKALLAARGQKKSQGLLGFFR